TEAAPAPAGQEQQPAPALAGAPRPAVRDVAASAKRSGARKASRIVINVTCNEKLASCRRWIDREVAKRLRTTRTAARGTAPEAS
ncbi:MAG: hypothetical protein J2P50_09290, partial [Hyphomicrobiaceae bacterium]|nr:hypothetical protein [Hyphomicrobiaceae bacterium]